MHFLLSAGQPAFMCDPLQCSILVTLSKVPKRATPSQSSATEDQMEHVETLPPLPSLPFFFQVVYYRI